MSYQLTTTLLGLLLGGMILYMVRRDRLHGPYAYWWLTVAGATAVLGIQPRLIDQLAELTGVGYPPALLFALAIGAILLKMLRTDIESSRHERRIRRLAQHLAILAEENAQLRERLDARRVGAEQRRTGSE